MMNRRRLIGSSAAAFAGTMVTRPVKAELASFQPLPGAKDERTKMLITTALDAAKTAGADYVDARLTFSQGMSFFGDHSGYNSRPFDRKEYMAFGVRALCDGYWGFASSTVWTKDEAARLGRVAVDSAKANFSAKPREVDMAPNPDASSGDWVMPVKDDPFAMDPYEISDFLNGLKRYLVHIEYDYVRDTTMVSVPEVKGVFNRQQKAFGSSDGQFITQRLYRTGASIVLGVDRSLMGGSSAAGPLKYFNLNGAGAGFELIRTPRLREWCREHYEELLQEALLPVIPVDVGRFNCLIHPDGVAHLVKKTVGVATEIDRVMGFEANATGTSYISSPEEELGSLKIGTSALNVTATRSAPGALMHVKWDDEGVEPRDVKLVENGVITNLQTGREGTTWMKGYLQAKGFPVISNGSSYSIDGHDPQVIHPSDLILHADPKQDVTLAQLREQMGDGIELKNGAVLMDFQQSTGMFGSGSAFQIKKGKRVARIGGMGVLFRTSELWGNFLGLGGPSSSLRVGTGDYKSNPLKWSFSSVDAPPALFKELSVINPAQKA